MTGGARNIFARNCTMGGSSLHYGLYIKADSAMGGFAEDIHLRDVTVTELNHEVISINLSHSGTVNGPYPPTVVTVNGQPATS
jgi:polygalacturonase